MSEEVVTEVVTEKPKKVKKPKSKARKIVEYVLFGIFGVLFAFILAGNISGEVNKKDNYGQSIRFGFGTFIVLTNSMEPEIKTDSAILTYKDDLSKVYSEFKSGKHIDVTFANVSTAYDGYQPDTEDFKRENGGSLVITNRIMTHRIREIHVNSSVKYGKGRYVFVAAGINLKGKHSDKHQYQIFTEKQYLGTVKISNMFMGKVFNFMVSVWGLLILLLVPAIYLIVMSSIDIFKALKESEAQEAASSEVPEGGKLSTVSGADRERLKKELLEEMRNKRKEKADEK